MSACLAADLLIGSFVFSRSGSCCGTELLSTVAFFTSLSAFSLPLHVFVPQNPTYLECQVPAFSNKESDKFVYCIKDIMFCL